MTLDALTLPHMAHGAGACTADHVNVRAKASLAGQVRGQMRSGERVIVWAAEGDWLLVQTDAGLTGWSAARYIALDGALIP